MTSTRHPIRVAGIAALLSVLLLAACGESVRKPVERVLSSDGQYWAQVHLDRASVVIGGNWYAVQIVEAHPRWYQFLPRMRGVGVCTLQGPGRISIRWAGPRKLAVICTACDRKSFYIFRPGMRRAKNEYGVTVEYRFRSQPTPPASADRRQLQTPSPHRAEQ